MSKGKSQNKNNNKSSKVPVKSQPMKSQKAAVIKPIQVTGNKNNQKTVVKPSAKPVAKGASIKMPEVNKKQVKPTKQEVDIAESDDDEDEDDVEFDDSDIDDVDLGDSDDEDISDDDDLSIEDIDNSDLESIELDEENIKSDDESEEVEIKKKETTKVEKKEPVKAVEKKEPVKAVEKKEPVKVVEKKEPVKVVEKKEPVKVVEKKEPVKVVEKKEPVKVVEKKEPVKAVVKKEPVKAVEKKEKIIDPTTKEGKALIEINRRKNYFNEVVVFINKVPGNFTRDAISQLLKENNLSAVNINLPGKIRKQNFKIRGYGFIRLVNTEDSKKAIEILNAKEFDGKKIKASSYVCKKVYDDINKVNFCKLIVQTFSDEDNSELIKKHFKNAKVTKYLNTQYGLEFDTKEEASNTFNKETITIGGQKLVFNYLYTEKSTGTNDVSAIPEVVATVEKIEAKPVEEVVKAGVKRSNRESSSDEDVEVIKKTKLIDGSESATKVEKKVLTPKKSIEVAKTPEKKMMTPQNMKGEKKTNNSPANGKAPFNKSQGDKKQFNNSPGNKKQFNKSPGDKKQFNKSPGDKKQFNKSPAGKNGKNFPGNKKFNKK